MDKFSLSKLPKPSSITKKSGLGKFDTLINPTRSANEDTNFSVIDEGFGSLDSENLSNMKGAFDYLKTRFGSVFIISHLDTIKDFMDYLLPITNKRGYSNIVYS